MPTTTRSPRIRALAAACALVMVATACGDDDDTDAATDDTTATTAAEGETAGGEFDDYCAAIAEMEENEGFDAAQFERIKETAPDEIRVEIDYVADAFIESEGDIGAVFADPKVEEMLGPIEDFEAENCPGEGDGDDEQAIAPEFAEYCEKSAELDEQDEPPTVEQVQELGALAPDAIAEEIGTVVDAFVAADGDIGKIFSDPAIEEAFGPIEEWEDENCGGGGDEDEGEDGEPDTEAAEGAQVVPVQAVDFGFEGVPAEVPSGLIAFEMTNAGEAAHEMAIYKLGEGVDLEELLASEEEPSEEDAMEVGGTFAPPGQSAFANVELDPGTYAFVCFIPGPEGKAHHELGMKTTFTVA